MIEKTKKVLIAILSAMVIVFVIYGIFILVGNQFKEPDILTKDEIKLYTIDINRVLSYSSYYFMCDCVENIAEGARRGQYNELYNCYMEEYKESKDKRDIYAELKEFGVDGAEYSIKDMFYADDIYFIECEINGQDRTILITMDAKETSYQFAIM